jgi:hypothetical protein
MKKIILTVALFCNTLAFSQLDYINDFKQNEFGLFEMTFKDPVKAIYKYNYVLDKNGSDTIDIIYNITKNPVDFGFFSNDQNSDNVIVSIFLRDGNKYKIIFTEIDGSEDKYFFDVIDQNGVETALYYRKRKK